jgi:hypothetical protein
MDRCLNKNGPWKGSGEEYTGEKGNNEKTKTEMVGRC